MFLIIFWSRKRKIIFTLNGMSKFVKESNHLFFDWSDNTKKISMTSVDVVLREKEEDKDGNYELINPWCMNKTTRCCLLSLLSDFWRVSFDICLILFLLEYELCSDKRKKMREREKRSLEDQYINMPRDWNNDLFDFVPTDWSKRKKINMIRRRDNPWNFSE